MKGSITLLMISEGDNVDDVFNNRRSTKETITKTVSAVTNMIALHDTRVWGVCPNTDFPKADM
jgi:hypothetical protein